MSLSGDACGLGADRLLSAPRLGMPSRRRWLALAPAALSGCASPAPLPALRTVPLRFLLSFDDGPSAREGSANPSARVLECLAGNAVQPGIKALFFVQTGTTNGGATPLGQALLRRMVEQGHVLGFHTSTAGHTSHTLLDDAQLEASLREGMAQLMRFRGGAAKLVRPPHWRYDARTFAAYRRHGLGMLLTDLSANDGKPQWPNGSPRRRSHFEQQMRVLRARLQDLPVVDGVRPVLVTFHDTNPFTAERLEEYLQILLDSAVQAGLPLHEQPFYDGAGDIERAALARTLDSAEPQVPIPGFWTSLRYWLLPA